MDLQGGSLNIVTRQLYSTCCPKTPFPEEESKEDSRPFQLSRAYELSLCSVLRVKELWDQRKNVKKKQNIKQNPRG